MSVSIDPSPIKISPPASPILIEPVPALEMLISSCVLSYAIEAIEDSPVLN